MNKISSALSFIAKKRGVHLILLLVMGILLFVFLILNGWLNYTYGINQSSSKMYCMDGVEASVEQFEEWYDAVHSSGSIDEVTVFALSDSNLPVFNPKVNSMYYLVSAYPAFLQAPTSDTNSFEYYLSSRSYSEAVTYIKGLFPEEHDTATPASIPFEHDERFSELCWNDSNSFHHTFHQIADMDTPDIYTDKMLIFTSTDAIIYHKGVISEVIILSDSNITSNNLKTINRLTENSFGLSFEPVEDSEANTLLISKRVVYVIVLLALIATFQILSYAFSMRQDELKIYKFCGETPFGIFMHYFVHFSVILVISILLGSAAYLLLSPVVSRTGFDISLSHFEILRTIGIYFVLSMLSAVLYLLLRNTRFKGVI